ncbi:PEP-utilizing enzyme [Sphingomonas sp. SUN019]|uniref:PEP-utilizing enzyme n=1 Tax=Sphingomonas sp. SUN019 TaxID=2937788 RepID=UPI0021646948|nr:PEP-utilizing enzyme [Sphingomonas sp. SUN019]UVO52002.1 PEP-utilizing enzyme [Sphingomonas sp. SUN019]
MAYLPIDTIRHARPPASPIVEATLALVRARIRDAYGEHLKSGGAGFDDFVFAAPNAGITRADLEAVEQALLDAGHRFDWSAAISVAERPDAYKGGADSGADFMFDHAEAVTEAADSDGRTRVGQGDNVVRHDADVSGTARYIRSNDRVLAYLTDGVPAGTIAIIDDSGGTLTAPIIDQFAGILCAGGTVRSHLGILAREFGIPCFMNAKLSGIRDGDRVLMETTAAPRTTEDYQTATERTGRVWRLEGAA